MKETVMKLKTVKLKTVDWIITRCEHWYIEAVEGEGVDHH